MELHCHKKTDEAKLSVMASFKGLPIPGYKSSVVAPSPLAEFVSYTAIISTGMFAAAQSAVFM